MSERIFKNWSTHDCEGYWCWSYMKMIKDLTSRFRHRCHDCRYYHCYKLKKKKIKESLRENWLGLVVGSRCFHVCVKTLYFLKIYCTIILFFEWFYLYLPLLAGGISQIPDWDLRFWCVSNEIWYKNLSRFTILVGIQTQICPNSLFKRRFGTFKNFDDDV